MPPVLGPASPSPSRLKSRAAGSGTTRVPSVTTSSEHSGPASPSSITTRRPAAPKDSPASLARTSASASWRSSVTRTPLPAAKPSVFTTHGPGSWRRKATASSGSSNTPKRAVGTLASASSCFMNALDPSSRAPSAPGPTTSRPSARSRSASPSTRGCSGPITTRSASTVSGGASLTVMRYPPATAPGIPGLPGVTTTSAVRAKARASACSRPPDPTTQTFTASCTDASGGGADPRAPAAGARRRRPLSGDGGAPPPMTVPLGRCHATLSPSAPASGARAKASRSCGEADELLAAGTHADQLDGHADLLRQEGDVLARRRGQVRQRGCARQVGAPARQLLVDRRHLVQHRLVVRRVGVPLASGLVGHAHLDRVEGVEDVELGEGDLRQRIEAHGLAEHDAVEPAAASAPAGVGAVLVTALDQHVADGVQALGGKRAGPHPGDIRLGNADHLVDLARPDARPGARPTGHGVRGRDERVGAVVEIEERGLGALEQDVPAGVEGLVHHGDGVDDHRLESRRVLPQVGLADGLGVDGQAVVHLGQDAVLLLQRHVELLAEDLGIEQVLDPQAHP